MLRRLYTQYSEWSVGKNPYLFINSDARFRILIKNDTFVKQVEEFKYLRVVLDGDDMGSSNIRLEYRKLGRFVGALNFIWWKK